MTLLFLVTLSGATNLFGQITTTALPVTSSVSVMPSDLTVMPITTNPLESCSESGLQPNDWQARLSFAQFDPSLGDLQRIEIRMLGKTEALMELEGEALPSGQSQVKLSSELELLLPGEKKLRMEPVAELNSNRPQAKEAFSGEKELRAIFEEGFQPYLGTGELTISAVGKGYNSKDKTSPVQLHTQSAISVCIYYHYQPKN
ncbi:MAG: choice-of-anchor E domain-containing protein [Phaeodactylibacter sp.]|nr:choice-of-anchor E domain-containing protein [Phaeodactylibacter sp.]